MRGLVAMDETGIAVVNHYRLLAGRQAFLSAVAALSKRVEAEGHRGVLEYRFHCSDEAGEGRAMVRYRDAEAWLAHHDLAMGWPEMARLRAAAELEEINLFGPITDAMRDWFDRMGLAAKVRHHGEPVAGFRR